MIEKRFLLAALLTTTLLTGCQSYSPTATTWETLLDPKHPERYAESFRGYRESGPPTAGWTVDGESLKTVPGFAGADLMTRHMYANFELEFEWKTAATGRAAVLYNVVETDAPPWTTGPAYPLAQDGASPATAFTKTSAAALNELIAPNQSKLLRSPGDFNRTTIYVKGGNVEHWLNGSKVLEYRWSSPTMTDLIKYSPFAGMPQFMKKNSGYIVFQNQGSEIWIRRIRVRRL